MRAPLQVQTLTDGLATPWTALALVPETASTNADLAAAARAGTTPVWSVLVAEHQSAGRGRLGRTWTSVRGATLTFSALVPTPPAPGWVPLVAGLAVAAAMQDRYAVRPALKWPNDVLAPVGAAHEGRKLAGVLCELTPRGIVVGMGINVDQGEDELPVPTATSLRLVAGGSTGDHPREDLLHAVLDRLAEHLEELLSGRAEDAGRMRGAYRRACVTVGREVALDLGGDAPRVGRAVEVDREGRLVVDLDGERHRLTAGDVTHVR